MKKQTNTNILLISGDLAYTAHIKGQLDLHMRTGWIFEFYNCLQTASPCFKRADIILLDTDLADAAGCKDVFKKVKSLGKLTPIITLTGDKEAERVLATFSMAHGAADIVMKKNLDHLADAIEFALIRHKITAKQKRASDTKLSDSQTQGAKYLKESVDGRAGDNEKNRQTISMLSGGYSFDSTPG